MALFNTQSYTYAMKIGSHKLGRESPTFVIAEAGSNHNQDLETAKRLIDTAAEAGAEAVKFQVFKADELYVENSGMSESLEQNKTIHDLMSSLELPRKWIPKLSEYCDSQNILFIATPFDKHAVNILSEYVPVFKIASSSVTHLQLLETVAATEKPILMSTGFHEYDEIETAVNTLQNNGATDIGLFHCVGAYPTPLDEINIRALDTLREKFSLPVGLSDHTLDPIIAPCTAVSRDAVMIEKHFTIDKSMDGPDHSFALEPSELNKMISKIRRVEEALGSGSLDVRDVEKQSYELARRSVHAAERIEQGEELTSNNTTILRPGKQAKGIPPTDYDKLLGKAAAQPISKDEGINWDDVK
jgi:sialic acid synthase SpsE